MSLLEQNKYMPHVLIIDNSLKKINDDCLSKSQEEIISYVDGQVSNLSDLSDVTTLSNLSDLSDVTTLSNLSDLYDKFDNSPPMNIKNFEDLRITTMTLVINLSSTIDIYTAFVFLPITKIDVNIKELGKNKLPHCSTPGSIISMRYKDESRGIIRSLSSPFKNTVTIDISTIIKNINLKLSPVSIQMCGASSEENGLEAAQYIINHLLKIQNIVNKIKNDECVETLDWCKYITQGSPIIRYSTTFQTSGILKINKNNTYIDYLVELNKDIVYPENIDKDVADYILNMAFEFKYHSDFVKKINILNVVPKIAQDDLHISSHYQSMVNYNYSLGFFVDRALLNIHIDGKNGFISRYNNALANSVTVELPYEIPDNINRRRRNKIPHHTFLIYKSGSVTQSGPGGELMKKAYMLFMETIANIKSLIQYKN